MGRPVYVYELNDPDFCWLISHFQESNPGYFMTESGSLPVIFIKEGSGFKADDIANYSLPNLPLPEELDENLDDNLD